MARPLLRPRARRLDDLAPLLDLARHIGAEAFRRMNDWRRRHGGETGPGGRVGKARIDLAVEPGDDLGRGAARHADPAPGIRLVSWHCLADGRRFGHEFAPAFS